MRSKSKQQFWDVWLRTPKQRLAAFTALLMLALGLIIGRSDYEQPHLHIDGEPALPTTRVSMSTSGTPSVTTFSSSSYLGPLLPGRQS